MTRPATNQRPICRHCGYRFEAEPQKATDDRPPVLCRDCLAENGAKGWHARRMRRKARAEAAAAE